MNEVIFTRCLYGFKSFKDIGDYWYIIVKDLPSQMVYLNICIKQQTCEKLSSIGRRSCKIIMKEKNTLVTRNCALSDA